MAILAIFTGKGITKSHYEALRREVNWVQRWPEGIIFHAAAFDTAGGIRVADVWESQAALDDFFNKRLLPVRWPDGPMSSRRVTTMFAGEGSRKTCSDLVTAFGFDGWCNRTVSA